MNPWAVAGGSAALWYLTDQSMASLRNLVSSNAPMIYPVYSSIVFTSSMTGPGWSCHFPCFVAKGGLAVQYTDGSYASLPDPSYYHDTFSIIPFNGMNPTKQALADAAKNLSSAAILAEAASAAADFAKSATDRPSTIAAAKAAAAANEWVKNDPSANSPDLAKAQAAATAAALAASSSQTDGCTKQEKYELQQEVKRFCKEPEGAKSCKDAKNLPMTREEAGKNAAKFEACAVARDTINNKCFGGGNEGHQNAANNARNGAKTCRQLEQSLPF